MSLYIEYKRNAILAFIYIKNEINLSYKQIHCPLNFLKDWQNLIPDDKDYHFNKSSNSVFVKRVKLFNYKEVL